MTGRSWIDLWNGWADAWAGWIFVASWQGGLALALAGAVHHAWSRMPAVLGCWLWRLAFLKLLLALFWVTPVKVALLPAASSPSLGVVASPPAARPWLPPPVVAALPTTSPPATIRPEAFPWLPLLWLAGVAGVVLRLVRDARSLRTLRRAATPVEETEWTGIALRLSARLRLGDSRELFHAGCATPRLMRSRAIDSPLLVGILQPAILLPDALVSACSPSDRTLIMAHELAHLKRRDLWWNWLPAAAQALFWFHPLVWLAGREWRLAQELACDELAVGVSETSAAEFGNLLLRVAARRVGRERPPWITLGVLEEYATLRRRLRAMKRMRRFSGRQMAVVGTLLVGMGSVGLVPWKAVARAGVSGDRTGRGNRTIARGMESMTAMKRLTCLGHAMLLYAEDYDARTPPMADLATVRQCLLPYLGRDESTFLDPLTGRAFQPNAKVSGKRFPIYGDHRGRSMLPLSPYYNVPYRRMKLMTLRPIDIAKPWRVAAFYSARHEPDRMRAVLFLDGHVSIVSTSTSDWPRIKRDSGIPDDPSGDSPSSKTEGAASRSDTSQPPPAAGAPGAKKLGFSSVDEYFLLPFPTVRTEIGLSERQQARINSLIKQSEQQIKAQKSKAKLMTITELPAAMRRQPRARSGADWTQQAMQLFTPRQRARLHQLVLRVNGGPALLWDEVAGSLQLLPQQKTRIQAILERYAPEEQAESQQTDLPQVASAQTMNALRHISRVRSQAYREALTALTAAQRTRWQRMIGAPWELGVIITRA